MVVKPQNPMRKLEELKKFYSKLYETDESVKFKYVNDLESGITQEQKEALDAPITMQELSKAVKSLKRGKSPGNDGLINEFYMLNWEKIKEHLFQAIVYGLNNGKIHDSALKGLITLIPKKGKDVRFVRSLTT